MNKKLRLAIGAIFGPLACALLIWVMLSLQTGLPRNTLSARRRDMEALLQVLLANTNVLNSEQLLAAAAEQGVRLSSPIALDPTRPCYELLTPRPPSGTDFAPQRILIRETNIRDTSSAFIATMDGAVHRVNQTTLKRQLKAQLNQ